MHDFTRDEERIYREILATNIDRARIVTHAVCGIGIVLGLLLVGFGIAQSDRVVVMAGAAELIVVPIIVGGRYKFLQVFSLVQKLESTHATKSPGL